MKKLIALLLVELTLISPALAKIQDADVKSLSEVGSVASRLINDTKIYDSTNGQQLSTSIATGALGGGSSGATKNYVKNPGAESNTTDVTASGSATVTRNTTTPLYGSGDFSITLPNAATGEVTWTLNTLDNALKGQNCELDFYYTASSIGSAVKFEVLQGSNVVIQSDLLAVNSNPQLVKVNVPCGDLSSATTARIANQTGNSGTSAIKVDQVIYGAATSIGSVAQSQFLGSLTWQSTTNCSWSRTSSTFGDFSADVDCDDNSRTVTGSVVDNANGTPGQYPAFVLKNVQPGRYLIIGKGSFSKANTSNDGCNFRYSDGNGNFSSPSFTGSGPTEQTNGTLTGEFSYTSAQGDVTFRVQARNEVAGACNVNLNQGGGDQLEFTVYRFPTSSEIAYRPELQALSWSGYHDASYSNWNFTSTGAFADPASNTNNGNDVTELTNRNFGTVTSYVSGARKLPGIVITPKKTGRFYVCAVTGPANAGTSGGSFQLNDLTNSKTIAEAAVADTSNNSSVTLCGILDIPNLSAITLAVQGKKGAAGTMLITSYNTTTRMMNWSIFALDQNIPAPVLVGSVTSGSTGAERIERVRFGGASERSNCTASPCTIYSQSGSWVSSVTRNATGNYTVNIASGVFSVEPTCSGNAKAIGSQNTALIPVDATGSATSKRFDVMRLGAAGTNDDAYVEYVCYGPR